MVRTRRVGGHRVGPGWVADAPHTLATPIARTAMKPQRILAAVLLLFLPTWLINPASASPRGDLPSLAKNGDFEVPHLGSIPDLVTYFEGESFGGWTVSRGSVDLIGSDWNPGQANTGVQDVDLSGLSAGAISQRLHTRPGGRYIVFFALAGNLDAGPVVKTMRVLWDGDVVGRFVFDTRGKTYQSMGYERHMVRVKASSTISELTFASAVHNPFGPFLDTVRVLPPR